MKKRSIKFEINFTNKWFYTFIALGVVLVLAIGVFAYNSGKAPNVMGHSGEEIMVSVNGQEVSLNDALSSISSSGFGDFLHNSNGYEVLPSGLIIQWGKDTTPKKVIFPKAFPNNVFSVTVSHNAGAVFWYGNEIFVNSVTKSDFWIQHRHGDKDEVEPVYWIAIGN